MKRHVLHISILFLSVIFLPFSAGASSYPYISGHGVNFATGNKYVQETDVRLDGPVALSPLAHVFARFLEVFQIKIGRAHV